MNSIKILGTFVFILFIAMAVFSFAEEAAVLSSNNLATVPALESSENIEGDTQWVWGEVTNLDVQAGTFTLKYLDYENDQENSLVLGINENTAYENIKSFNEIKIKDTLSIDYKVAPDGKNLAKNISLEKPDILPVDAQDTLQMKTVLQADAPVIPQPAGQTEAAAPEESLSATAQEAE